MAARHVQLVQEACGLLQEAILDVLGHGPPEGLAFGLLAGELGIHGHDHGYRSPYSGMLRGQLHILRDAGKVWQPQGARRPWALTPEERTRRAAAV